MRKKTTNELATSTLWTVLLGVAGLAKVLSKQVSPAPPVQLSDQYTKDLGEKLRIWLWKSKVWATIHWVVGTASVSLSALSAAKILQGHEPYQTIVAVGATITVGFLGFANPQRNASRHVRAYVILDPALRDYRMGLMDAKTLTQVHRQAEATLHGTGDNPTPTTA
jgi:hypothetical protein